jgi:spermidine/putrescine transport system ATP-binding protein
MARLLTQRPKVLVFNRCYHGTVDEAFAVLGPNGETMSRPGNMGPQVDPRLTTKVVEFNDVEALEAALEGGDVAVVLAEPVMTNIGIVQPAPGFHEELRRLTRKYGSYLAIDETHTICAGPGGCTAALGLEPDFVTLGKAVGGGVPAAAYGFSEDIARRFTAGLDPAEADLCGIGGTLAGNPLSLAAMRATLERVLTEEFFRLANELQDRFAAGVEKAIREYAAPWTVERLGLRSEYRFSAASPRERMSTPTRPCSAPPSPPSRGARDERGVYSAHTQPTLEGASIVKGATITIDGVSKFFGNFPALKGVSLEIKKGEFFSLLGSSGCGKTTLLRIIGGFEEPDSGRGEIDGRDILPLPPNMRHANTVFQNEAHAAKMPSMLSGGQKQRVAIARALINEPSVLLLDEPLSALDAKLRHHMLMELDAIHDKVGITFIYVTHDQAEALSVSDRIAVMDRGNVLQVGTPREIYESPSSSFVAQFIGETNMIDGIVESMDGRWYVADAGGIGRIAISDPRGYRVGDRVTLTVRPERLRIAPQGSAGDGEANVFEGRVDESVYSGFLSKYYVRVGTNQVLRVFRQHGEQGAGEDIAWNDKVRVSWSPADAYIVGGAPT